VSLRALLREPIVHFLALGTALFVLSGWRDIVGARTQSILVSAGQSRSLAAMFERTWMRPPTAEELQGLVRDHLREEVAYREALVMGLDRDDTIIRRRLRQKLEFLSDELSQPEPTEAELRAYHAAHPDAFREEPRASFQQVFLDPDRHDGELARDVERLLMRLRSSADALAWRSAGDATLLEPEFRDARISEVADGFGRDFAERLANVEPGVWSGPIPSAYGVHLVLVRERTAGSVATFEGVREAVRREWENARRIAATDALYDRLLERYEVTIESIPAGAR
jgi:hypothetical protein